ncbi:MAG TPA: AAA family ATPase [Stellaceae bacterium]|nr:AAA family ATPase [Stellaceae bacterium]
MPDYFKDLALRLFDKGYPTIPIVPGDKRPAVEGWADLKITRSKVNGWQKNGHAKDGVGFQAATLPLLDIDIHDRARASQIVALAHKELGPAPIRVGQFPKAGLPYRTRKPFSKITSREFVDGKGRKAQVEMMAEGQQWVAFHVHPDTHKPYRWLKDDSPLERGYTELTEITEAKAKTFIARCEELMRGWGWQEKRSTTLPARAPADPDYIGRDQADRMDDVSDEEFLRWVCETRNDERFASRDVWTRYGMGIHHQLSEAGRDAWLDFCERWEGGVQGIGLPEKAWESFGKHVEGREVVTGRFVKQMYDEQRAKKRKAKIGPLQYLDFDEAKPQLDNLSLIKGAIDRTALHMAYGDSSVGKTFVMLHAAYCVAAGVPFFGRKVSQGAVLYIAAEAGPRIENRVAAIRRKYSVHWSIPLRVVTSRINLYADEDNLEQILELARETAGIFGPVVWIIIDTLNRAMPGMNENASEDMGVAIERMERLREEAGGATVTCVHHSGKDASRGSRGHGSMHNALDQEWAITRDDDIRTINLGSKQRDAADDSAATFKLDVVKLGFDADGDEVSSCVIEELNDTAPRPASGAATKLSDAQKGVVDTFNRLQNDGNVTFAQLRKACSEPGVVSNAGKHRYRLDAFLRAFRSLPERFYIHEHSDGTLSRHPELDTE